MTAKAQDASPPGHASSYATADARNVLHLDLNTNLHGPNPVLSQVGDVVEDLAAYPSERSDRLRGALAARHGLSDDQVVCSNGADSVLDICMAALADPGDAVVTSWPGFEMYPYFADLRGLTVRKVPLRRDDLAVPLDALAEAAKEAALVLLANPNNPTGRMVPPDRVLALADAVPGTVVVDEAYVEYADSDGLLPHVADRTDLVVVRTFSKAFGLAGLRVGWAAAHADTAEHLARARPPFHLNALSEALAVRALDEDAFAREAVAAVAKERERLAGELGRLGFAPLPSRANFVLARCPDGVDPAGLHAALRDRGILVRVFPGEPLLSRMVRVTVGRPEHTDRLVQTLEDLPEAGPTDGTAGAATAADDAPADREAPP